MNKNDKLRKILLLFTALLLCCAISCGQKEQKKKKAQYIPVKLPAPAATAPAKVNRVVFVMLDATRADRFGVYGYGRNTTPNMDAIAGKGMAFSNHFAQGPTTRTSMPPLMTGKYFTQGVIEPMEEIPSKRPNYDFIKRDPSDIIMPQLFSENGWKSVAFSAHTGIEPDTMLGKSFDKLYELEEGDLPYMEAEHVIPQVEKWIIENRDEQFFLYVHLMDVHSPHYMKAEHKQYIDPNYDWKKDFTKDGKPKIQIKYPWSERFYVGKLEPPALRHLTDLYDGDLNYVDKWVGELYKKIEELGIAEDTLFIITADHGEELGEHEWWTHVGRGAWDTSFHIPMIMVRPGTVPQGRKAEGFTQHVDILPTLMDMYGLKAPEGKTYDGKSLMGIVNDPSSTVRDFACAAWLSERFIRTKENSAGTFYGERQLYDVAADPGRNNNIAGQYPDLLDRLIAQVQAEVGESHKKWMALPFTKPQGEFLIGLIKTVKGENIPESDDPDKLDVEPGQWITKREYLIGRGGKNPRELTIVAKVPDAQYTLDFGCIHAYGFIEPDSSDFFAAVGDGPMRRYSTTDKISLYRQFFPVHSDKKRGWRRVWLPVSVIEVKNQELILRIRPSKDPDELIVIESIRLRPVGVKGKKMSDKERKNLKALGYLE